MKRSLLISCALTLCCTLCFKLIAQEDPLNGLISKLQRVLEDYPQEKVHIHTDKPYYVVGDSLWFKGYIVNAEKNGLSGLSKILYVDLINERDSIKKSLRIPVVLGLAWGDMVLTDSLTEGNYRLRAYTNWMRNFGEEYYFDKVIRIGRSLPDQVHASVNYTFSKTAGGENIRAEILYVDGEGKPVSSRDVSYSIELDNRVVSRGKGETDDAGKLTIEFTNKQSFLLKSGRIFTQVETGEKRFQNKSFLIKATNAEVDVQFFPEGGQLIAGSRGRVAFKAVGADGLSRTVSGVLKDQTGAVIREFSTEHAGMGAFVFTPAQGATYSATMTFEDGSQKTLDLPKVLASGYNLFVNNQDDTSIKVSISASADLLGPSPVTLIAESNGVVKFAGRNMLNKPNLVASIPKDRFQTGIVRLTLFSAGMTPVAERLVFVRRTPTIEMTIENNKPEYGLREKVDMSLKTRDGANAPVAVAYSLAVINESKIPSDEDDETTILSNLLLSSDLKGYIEKPNYYFSSVSEVKDQHLDLLMMTQGWSRFTWKNTLAGIFPNIVFKPETGISISGTVKTLGGKPVANGKVMILASKGDGLLLDTVTGADGRFSFDDLKFTDSTRFVIQARNAKDKRNVEIELDRVPPQLVTKSKNSPDIVLNVNASMLPYLQVRRDEYAELRKRGLVRRNILLDEVRVSEKKPPLKNSSNLNGAGRADAVITGDKLRNCVTIEQCLQGQVAGVVFRNGIAYSTRSMNTPMQIIVDGMYVEPDYLTIIQPFDVESIEVLRTIGNTAIYGMRGGGGVLVINTRRGEPNYAYSYAPGITTYSPAGYHVAREFYSPNYDSPKLNKTLPDLRTTVLWVPHGVTDSSGKGKMSYFTSDNPGVYKVVAEGLDSKGGIFRKVFRYTVK